MRVTKEGNDCNGNGNIALDTNFVPLQEEQIANRSDSAQP